MGNRRKLEPLGGLQILTLIVATFLREGAAGKERLWNGRRKKEKKKRGKEKEYVTKKSSEKGNKKLEKKHVYE